MLFADEINTITKNSLVLLITFIDINRNDKVYSTKCFKFSSIQYFQQSIFLELCLFNGYVGSNHGNKKKFQKHLA